MPPLQQNKSRCDQSDRAISTYLKVAISESKDPSIILRQGHVTTNFLRKIYRAGKYYFKVASAMIGLPSKVVNKHFITNNVFTVPHKTFRYKTLNFHENMTEHDQNLLS